MIEPIAAPRSVSQSATASMERDGFEVVEAFWRHAERTHLLGQLGSVEGPGERDLLRAPEVAAFARAESTLALLRRHMIGEPLPVRAIYFNKTPEANWLVRWHQDLTIAVSERHDVPGFGPWSTKHGVPHVQPPTELMQRVIALRLHFDDADSSNGALRVIPGTHRLGRLSAAQINATRARASEIVCSAAAGDALLMYSMLLHASSRSTTSRPRRVLHIEYADFALPDGLQWYGAGGRD
jgi:ectoine hydroxylase-related dioxygenase (phytanoyl-CoA dioxygenase family)